MYANFTIALIIISTVANCFGQSVDKLKHAFVGKTVEFKIEMPATDNGVEILADSGGVIKEKSYLSRLRKFGRAYRIGEIATITCVNVKKKQIEICIGGGGYRTIDHLMDTNVFAINVGKSRREKQVAGQLDDATDDKTRDKLQRELNRLKDRRDRENRYRRQTAATESRVLESVSRQKALEAGSRFVIRFGRRVVDGDLDADKIVSMLEVYAEIIN